MNKAVFLDRDGTINIERHYLHRIEDFEFIPGAIEAMRILQDRGYKLVIVTNQSGIGRGYYSEQDFEILTAWMVDELQKHGVEIERVYFCPHLADAKIEKYRIDCRCRKPEIGLYEQAIKDLNIKTEDSWAIGDKIRDCSICAKRICRGYLIGSNEQREVIEAVKKGKYRNVRYAADLLEAAKKIVEGLI